ncbi:erythrocyte membrane protein 1 (PfEMP1), truncated, putative [Plasmodium gaboni]|uniref:Erythrocyte membrane protein 1 (PfEMP1), truncated, putative n=1 Tax=Plasmodium gaboni TaxID=647221 RepID=A0ABY1UQP0_9APIC|nr:erythrocyte membrane protein 1 (PfEMP1), truncated, putative [Plasmodium gaboni]
MGNEISGRQTEVSNKYGIDLKELQKWYHGHYINFLKQEIKDKTWETKYQKEMKYKDGKTIHILHDKFCKWKDIQREIFEATLDNHRFLLYTWEERAKKIIDQAEVDNNFFGKKCDTDSTQSIDVHAGSSSPAGTSSTSNKTINLGICLPKRRENINKRLRNARKHISNILNKDEGSQNIKYTLAATTLIGSLALQTENEIDEFINKSSHNTEHVCKLLGRTYADYKEISKGKDVVEHDVSEDVQKLLLDIVKHIGGETKMEEIWKSHFRDKIENKLKEVKNSKKGSKNEISCTLDGSEEQTPQCLRYMQEFLEEFLEQKTMIEQLLEKRCKNKNSINDVNCKAYCTLYNDFISGRKDCYVKYKKQCEENLKDHSEYRQKEVYDQDVKEIEKKIKDKSGCNTCGSDHDVDLGPLFDGNDPNTNKSYYCHCENGKRRNNEPEQCKKKTKSAVLSLAGKWQQGIYNNNKNKPNVPSSVCGLQFRDHNSTGGDGEDPCGGIPSGTSWNCNDIVHEGICIPPRRQEICISNIRKLGQTDISTFNSNKLLLEIMLAAKAQAVHLLNHNHGRKRGIPHNVCDSIKLSFLDFGDIIKGTDNANDEYSMTTESNLKAIFEKIRDEWKKNGDNTYDDTTAVDGLRELRKDWWDKNKDKIWEAFNCDGTTKKTCGNGKVPDDSRSQFLRWLEEWGNEFCHEHKWMQQSVDKACQPCGKDCESSWTSWFSFNLFRPIGDICDCKNKCKEYSKWIYDKKKEFDNQKKYYDEKITSMDFGETSGTTPSVGSHSRGSTSATTKSSVSEYLNKKSKNSCQNIDFSKPEVIFSSYPDESHYRHHCSRCYAQLEADLTDKNGMETSVCRVDKILTKDKSSNITHFCNDKNLVNTVRKDDTTDWKYKNVSKTYSVSSGGNVGVPPRYDNICKDTIKTNSARDNYTSSHDYYDNNRMFLSELILIAKHEGKRLREHYKGRGGGTSSGHDEKSVFCTAIQRSFADIADIVKGTSIIHNEKDDVEKHLKDMFNKLRNEYQTFAYNEMYNDVDGLVKFRKNWWERNRHMIWEAFNCESSNHKSSNQMDMDKVPQLLRWITEWSEKFCKKQKEQYAKLQNACSDCTNGKCETNSGKNTQKCTKCTNVCAQYQEIINKWSNQWKEYNKLYIELYNKALDVADTTLDDNALYMRNVIREKNWGTLPFASEYVKGTMNINECEAQNEFGNINDDKYAFKTFPNGYDVACSCDQPQHKGSTNSGDTITTIITPQIKTDLCDKTNKSIKYERWECNQKDKDGKDTCRKKDEYYTHQEFSDLLEQWVRSFLNEYEAFEKKIKECTNKANGNTSDPNTCPKEDCPNQCYCYKKWEINRKYEWNKQKEYFKKHNNENDAHLTGANLGSLENLGRLGTLQYYLTLQFGAELKKALGPQNSLQEAQEKSNKYDEITQILMMAENMINECVNKCPKKLDCHQKGFVTNWKCNQSIENRTAQTNNEHKYCIRESIQKEEEKTINSNNFFFNIFNDWLEDIDRTIDEYIEILKISCDKTKTKNGKECNLCEDDCNCYKEWKKKIETQWGKQKRYFERYKENHEQMKHIDLDIYLQAKCELDATEKGKNEREAQQKCSKKNTSSGSDHTIFDEMLENKTKKQKSVCESCQTDNENKPVDQSTCDGINNVEHCNDKDYDDPDSTKKSQPKKNWKCTETGGYLEPNVCVPPRTQPLCIASMYNSTGDVVLLSNSEEDLKKKLKEAIKTETKRLYEYYQKKKTGKTSGQVPRGFCEAAYRSFNDFKHMVLGDMLWEPPSIKKVKDKIGDIIKSTNGGSGNTPATTEERQKWWNKNEHEFWNALKCGIKAGNGDPTSCPRLINDDDQFEWWAKEWSEDYYEKRKTLAYKVDAACKDGKKGCNGASGQTTPSGDCGKKCEEYKKFLQNKGGEWTKNFKKFLDDKEKEQQTKGKNINSIDDEKMYMPQNHYLLHPCTYQSCDGTHIKDLLGKKDHGELQNKCTCNTSPPSAGSSTDTENPCDDKFEFHACNEKKYDLGLWSSTYVTNPQDRGKVFAPPRRNSICIGWLFSPINTSGSSKMAAKNELRQKLMDAARGESHYLHKYYKTSGNTDTTKYCDALKRSYYDFGDIVKGTDLWSGGYSPLVQKNIHDVFAMKDDGTATFSEEQIKEERKKWWDQNKDAVWEAMNKCVKSNKCDNTTIPDDETKPQFLRWYEEWYEQFCKERDVYLQQISSECSNKGNYEKCETNDKSCQNVCSKYSKWINHKRNEWTNQKHKYQDNYQDAQLNPDDDEFKKATKDMSSPEVFLNDKYKDLCERTKVNDMDLIVEKKDTHYKYKYEPLCTRCRMKQLIDKAKEIKKKNDTSQQKAAHITTIDDICKNNNSEICDHVDDNGPIKVPIDPDNNDPNKNKEKNGNINCGGMPSDINDIKWVGKDHYTWLHNLNPNIYVSPRRRKLCYEIDGSKGENDLKKQLLTAAANDAYNLGIKYNDYKNHYGIKPCRALKYSFNDYKHIILGTDNLEPPNNRTEKKLNEIFKAENSGKANDGQSGSQQRKDWWNKNKKCVWDVMVCGYKKGKEEAYDNGNIPELTNNDGGGTHNKCDIPTEFDNTDQFLVWLREWYEDFCRIRNKLKSEVESSCKIEEGTFDCKKCTEKCKEYKKYMEGKKKEWAGQKTYYSNKRSEQNGKIKGYTEQDSTEYLKKKFTSSCDAKPSANPQSSSGDKNVQDNIDLLTKERGHDVDEHCTCKKYTNDEIYIDIVAQDNCEGLKSAANETQPDKKIKWRNRNDKGYTYLKNGNDFKKEPVPEQVYLPPRKQKLCFRGLDGRGNGVTDKNKLREHLLKVGATEGYNLGQYYNEKNKNTTDPDKYSYDVEPCNALKYSFYDLRDIILGYDMLEPAGTGTEINLKKIFEKSGDGKPNSGDPGKPGSQERQKFWEKNKDCVWNAMLCGFTRGTTNSDKDLAQCNQIPSDTTYPVGTTREDGKNLQFLRWFAEWGEDYCKHYTREYDKLKQKCKDCNVDNGKKTCGTECDECKKQCQLYQYFINKWKDQYNKQSGHFQRSKISGTYIAVNEAESSSNALEYLNKQLKNMICTSGNNCKCMEEKSTQNGNNDMPKSLDYPPEEIGDKCTCTNDSGNASGPGSTGNRNPGAGGASHTPQATTSQCKIKDYIKKNDETKQLNRGKKHCNEKKGNPKPKPWDCKETSVDPKHEGACMPPRRQILCIRYLKELTGNETTDDLKEVLIKSASLETYFLWEKYIEDKQKEKSRTSTDEIENQLKKGTIPDEFKRIMFYTFGDFKDLFVDKDISTNVIGKNDQVKTAKERITNIFQKNGQSGKTDEEKRKHWWDSIQEDVWNAMVCSLSYNDQIKNVDDTTRTNLEKQNNYTNVTFSGTVTKLSEFAGRPQFLRWMTEWGEDFCRKQKSQLETLQNACNDYTCGSSNVQEKTKCETECKNYRTFITKWKEHYNKQKIKYKDDKSSYEDEDAKQSEHAYQYLNKKLQKICNNGSKTTGKCDYNCMNDTSSSSTYMPASLDEKPDSVKNKCGCQDAPSPHPGGGPGGNTNTQPDSGSIKPGNLPNSTVPNGSGNQNPGSPNAPDTVPSSGTSQDSSNTQVPPAPHQPPPSGPPIPSHVPQKPDGTHGPDSHVPMSPSSQNNNKEFDELNDCPLVDSNVCNKYNANYCRTKRFDTKLRNWNNNLLKDSTGVNSGVLVPPRRTKICFSNITRKIRTINKEEHFTREVLNIASTEAKHLREIYKNKEDNESDILFDAIKYSFADIGNILKGDDMLEDGKSEKIKEIFEKIYKTEKDSVPQKRQNWWNYNKQKVWNIMLCHYEGNNNRNYCDEYEKIDEIDQFLRWLTEWSRQFCKERKNMTENVKEKCNEDLKTNAQKVVKGTLIPECKELLKYYENWFHNRNIEWKALSDRYKRVNIDNIKLNGNIETAEHYVKNKCPECNCEYNDLEDMFNIFLKSNQKLITTLDEKVRQDETKAKGGSINSLMTSAETLAKNISTIAPILVKKVIRDPEKLVGKIINVAVETTIKAAAQAKDIVEKVQQIQEQKNSPTPTPTPAPASPTPSTPPSTPTTSSPEMIVVPAIGAVTATILGILLYKWRSPIRSKRHVDDMIRILEIPQNYHEISTNKSSNRYIPYGSKYKGKTYIYVEGEETDDYLRDISSTDVTTSSSESEYEEMDINDIYGYKSPKYKTLIEVVLKPSNKTYDAENIHIDNIEDTTYIPSDDTQTSGNIPSDIPTNKFTEEEWSQLKKDFILNMLQNDNMDISRENLSGTPTTDTQPDIEDNSFGEKPFITSIQDRKLYSDDNEIIYNIDWNVPKNISTNTATYNSLYSGIDLINDSLNRGNDIYDELLKRKENELFGTKHTKKNTTFNNVATQKYDDPIVNQLDLFHTWLDRHRDMCNQWNNKEEMLSKLYEEWKNENKEHLLYTSTIDNINRINDENYNKINPNTQINHEHNDITSLEHLRSTNIPPNDITRNNNDSQTKNFRTNVSMDILMDENNNIPRDKDYLQNSYNF